MTASLKSPAKGLSVIPVQTGIQSFQVVICTLDTRSPLTILGDKLRGYDDFLRDRQLW